MKSKIEFPHPIRSVTVIVISIIGCLLAIGSIASAAVFNLADDWSGVNNPNGTWAYEGVYPTTNPVTDPTAFMAAKAPLTAYYEPTFLWFWGGLISVGKTFVHNDYLVGSSLTWKAPEAASCAITGSIVTEASQTAGIDLSVLFYDASTGTISSLWSGTTTVGGPVQTWSLTQVVALNDQILLYVPPSDPSAPENGSVTNWTANIVTTVPEPASLVLLGLGGLALLRRRK